MHRAIWPLALALPLLPTVAVAQDTSTIDRVAWLAGCWEAASPQGTVEEQWMTPRGGAMVGMSRSVRGGRVSGYELMVLRVRDDGLVYHAHPSGQPSAEFSMTRLGDSTAVFENPAHDFPQRIGYRRVSADSLVSWIEGTVGGQERRVEFPYLRVSCPD